MTAPVLESTERRLPPPTRDRVVWVWAAATFFAFTGDSIWLVGLAWAAVTVASPAVAGIVVAVGMVPQAVLLLVGGSIADRLDTRVVMVTANAVRVLTLLVGAVLWQAEVAPVALLIAVACVFGAADAFYLPAGSTMPRQMVHPEDLATLGGLFQVVRRTAVFAGSALGGWIAATQGLVTARVVDAIGFVVISVVVAVVLRPRFPLARSAAEPVVRAIRTGVSYVRSDATVRTFVVTLSGLNVFVGPALSLGVALRADTSDWGAGVVGAANACVGVGAAVGALAAMRVRPRRPAVSGFASLVLQGAAIVALGVDWLPSVIGGAVVIGVTAGWASVILSACFQRVIREDQLGRVSSMTMLSDYTLLPLATPFFGWLAATTSVTTTAAVFGAGMALAGLWGASRPAIRAVLQPSVRSGTMEA
jgi:MFS family permease